LAKNLIIILTAITLPSAAWAGFTGNLPMLALSLCTGYSSQGVFSYVTTKKVPVELILAVVLAMGALLIGKPEFALLGRVLFGLNSARTAVHVLSNKE